MTASLVSGSVPPLRHGEAVERAVPGAVGVKQPVQPLLAGGHRGVVDGVVGLDGQQLLGGVRSPTSARSSARSLLGVVVDAGLAGTFRPVWICHAIFSLPLAVFLLHNFMKDLPHELVEAARVDGAGHAQILVRVLLPCTNLDRLPPVAPP